MSESVFKTCDLTHYGTFSRKMSRILFIPYLRDILTFHRAKQQNHWQQIRVGFSITPQRLEFGWVFYTYPSPPRNLETLSKKIHFKCDVTLITNNNRGKTRKLRRK